MEKFFEDVLSAFPEETLVAVIQAENEVTRFNVVLSKNAVGKASVRFYDTRYPHTVFGQFTGGHYGAEIFLGYRPHFTGLSLYDSVHDWRINAGQEARIAAWMLTVLGPAKIQEHLADSSLCQVKSVAELLHTLRPWLDQLPAAPAITGAQYSLRQVDLGQGRSLFAVQEQRADGSTQINELAICQSGSCAPPWLLQSLNEKQLKALDVTDDSAPNFSPR